MAGVTPQLLCVRPDLTQSTPHYLQHPSNITKQKAPHKRCFFLINSSLSVAIYMFLLFDLLFDHI